MKGGIYLVADVDYLAGRSAVAVVQAAIAGGVAVVQLRAKHLEGRDYLALALAVGEAMQGTGVPLLLNDRADVALAAGAQGVHIGQRDLPATAVRAILGPNALIGLSVETMDEVRLAQALPINYVAASPVFATPTKIDTAPAWGLAGLARVCLASTLPVCAIGGLHQSNVAITAEAGAKWAAVVSAICGAEDVEKATSELTNAFEAGKLN